MLRINLLPDYIHDKNKIRNLGLGWTFFIVLVACGLLYVNSQAAKNLADARDDQAAKEALKTATDGLKTNVTNEKSKRKQIEDKYQFVTNAALYNDGWADVFETIRDVTPTNASIILNSLSIDKDQRRLVSIAGFGSSETTVVNWWMSLRNNTALFDHVNFNIVPHSWNPQTPNAGGGSGLMGGMGGPSSGGMGGKGSAPSMMSSTMAGAPGGGGPMSGGSMSGGPGMPGGSQGGTAGVGPAELRGKHGYNFTAAVVLKTALAGGIATPVWTGSGAAAAAPGIGGMGASMGMQSGPTSGPPPMSGGAPMSGGGARGAQGG